METGNAPLPCYVIKTLSNRVYFAAFLDLLCSVGGTVTFTYLLTYFMDDNRQSADSITACICGLVCFTLRIPGAVLILIGNNANVRLLWLGVGGQRIFIACTVVLLITLVAILGYYGFESLQILLPLWALAVLLIYLVGLRIEEIQTNSNADTPTA